MKRAYVTFAGSSVALDYPNKVEADLINFLFQPHLTAETASPQAHYRLQIDPKPAPYRGCVQNFKNSDKLGGMRGELPPAPPSPPKISDRPPYRLFRNDKLTYSGQDKAALAEYLLGDVCYQLAYHSRGGLLFHAAALSQQGVGLMLPGISGAGKSTLTSWLLSQGFNYLTDELVFIPHKSQNIHPFTRPLNLKPPTKTVLTQFFNLEAHQNDSLSSQQVILLPPTCLNPNNRLSQPPLKLIIFPHYNPTSNFVWRQLTKGQAGLALMECLVNARNLPEHGFPAVADICRHIPAYHLTYTHFEQVATQLPAIMTELSA